MKNLFYFFLFSFIISGCGTNTQKPNDQTKQKPDSASIQATLNKIYADRKSNTKIKGFGKLKLWESSKVVTEAGMPIVSIKTNTEYMRRVYEKTKGSAVYELVYDAKVKDKIYEATSDNRVKIYCIPNYQITDQIKLVALTLKYFNDSLFSVECKYNNDLEEALTLKYGESKSSVKSKEMDKTYTTEWNTDNSDVVCRSVLDIWHDPPYYKESSLHYIYLTDMSYNQKMKDAERNNETKGNEDKLKSELKNF